MRRRPRRGDRVDENDLLAQIPQRSFIARVVENNGRDTDAVTSQRGEHVSDVDIPARAPLEIARSHERDVSRSRAPPGPSRPPDRRAVRTHPPRARTESDA